MKQPFQDLQFGDQFELFDRLIVLEEGERVRFRQHAYTWARFDWLTQNSPLTADKLISLSAKNQVLMQCDLDTSLQSVVHLAFDVWTKSTA